VDILDATIYGKKTTYKVLGWGYGFKCHFQQYFSFIVTVSFISGGNWRTQQKPPTCRKSDKLYHIMLYRVHLAMSGI
jgi:hypothetical protein